MGKETKAEIVNEDLPAKQSDSILSIIEKATLSGDETATNNLERLYEMHKDTRNWEAEQAFNQDFVKAQVEMPVIIKDSEGEKRGSFYAKLDAISKKIKPIYTKHGFGMIGGTAETTKENEIIVTMDLIHKGGHSKSYKFPIAIDDKGPKGSPVKTKTHGTGSATTYAQRYLKCLIWDVITSKDDDGNAAGDPGKIDLWLSRLDEWTAIAGITPRELSKFWPDNEAAIRKDLPKDADSSQIHEAWQKAVLELEANGQ